MKHNVIAKLRWIAAIAAPAAIALSLALSPTNATAEEPANVSPSAFLTKLGSKFDGSPTCSSAKCHGAETSVNKKNFWGNEYKLWHDGKDPHHASYRTLVKPKSKQIAAALKIASALKSERCLNCHSTLAVGAGGVDLKGQEYTAAEGVSCNSCHGPSQKYREPHSKEGWIDAERTKGDHAYLLTTWGLYDTVPVFQRATRCASCHLHIEPELVAAGHPPPTFEMNHFSAIYPDRHWHAPAGTFPAELWANGQLAEIHDAMLQVALHAASKSPTAADEFKKAYDQAMAHFSVFNAIIESKAVASPDAATLAADVEKLSAAATAKDMAAAAAAATAAAEHSQAKGLVAALAQFKPDKAAALTVLRAVAAGDTGTKYGPRGEEQQAYAIEALAQAAGDDAILKAVAAILPAKPGEAPKPEDFAKGLADVRGKLPK